MLNAVAKVYTAGNYWEAPISGKDQNALKAAATRVGKKLSGYKPTGGWKIDAKDRSIMRGGPRSKVTVRIAFASVKRSQ